jgi:hypothetical protein
MFIYGETGGGVFLLTPTLESTRYLGWTELN